MNEPTSWNDVIDHLNPTLENYARRRMGRQPVDGWIAEDLRDFVLGQLIEHYPQSRTSPHSETRRLALRIARNKLIQLRASRSSDVGSLPSAVDEPACQRATEPYTRRDFLQPVQRAGRSEHEQLVRRAVASLTPDDRRLVELRNVDSLRFREIGRRLAISEDAARRRHERAARRLKRYLRDSGLTPSQITT